MNPKEMTGLQLLEAMCTGKIPPASISETIPMQPFEVSEGKISFKAKADHRHLNPLCSNSTRLSDGLCRTYYA